MEFDEIGTKKTRRGRQKLPPASGLSESQIQSQIVKYLQLKGYIVIRINSGASTIDDRYFKAYTLNYKGLHTCTSSGLFDLMAFKDGVTLCIECKTSKGRVSDKQQGIHDIFIKENFNVIIARDLQDVIDSVG